MTTKKKRIAISCSDELHLALTKLAIASGGSMVAMPTQILESNISLFNRLADAMIVASGDQQKGLEMINSVVDQKMIETAQISLDLNAEIRGKKGLLT